MGAVPQPLTHLPASEIFPFPVYLPCTHCKNMNLTVKIISHRTVQYGSCFPVRSPLTPPHSILLCISRPSCSVLLYPVSTGTALPSLFPPEASDLHLIKSHSCAVLMSIFDRPKGRIYYVPYYHYHYHYYYHYKNFVSFNNLTTTHKGKYYILHFTDSKKEVQKHHITCPRSCSGGISYEVWTGTWGYGHFIARNFVLSHIRQSSILKLD